MGGAGEASASGLCTRGTDGGRGTANCKYVYIFNVWMHGWIVAYILPMPLLSLQRIALHFSPLSPSPSPPSFTYPQLRIHRRCCRCCCLYTAANVLRLRVYR